jgi:hypothetical protein
MSTEASNGSQAQSIEDVASVDVAAESVATDINASADHIFEILKNDRRRYVLRYLMESNDSVTIGTLAEHIAAFENDTTLAALTSRERKCVYVGLYQNHLPKMADVSAIEFDKARGTIALGSNAAQFEPYLDCAAQESVGWSRYYLLLAGIGVVLFIIQSVVEWDVGLSLAQLLTGIICCFIFLSTVHLYCTSDRITSP